MVYLVMFSFLSSQILENVYSLHMARGPDIPLHGPIRYPERVPRDELAPELTKDTTTISLQSCKTHFSVEIHSRAKISMFTKQFYFGGSASVKPICLFSKKFLA